MLIRGFPGGEGAGGVDLHGGEPGGHPDSVGPDGLSQAGGQGVGRIGGKEEDFFAWKAMGQADGSGAGQGGFAHAALAGKNQQAGAGRGAGRGGLDPGL